MLQFDQSPAENARDLSQLARSKINAYCALNVSFSFVGIYVLIFFGVCCLFVQLLPHC